MNDLKDHLRHALLWLFNKNDQISQRQAAYEIHAVYGEASVTHQTCGYWLKKFRNGNKEISDLKDEKRSGRPSTFDEDELRRLVEKDPKVTIRELVERLNSSLGTVHRHLHSIGLVRLINVCFYFVILR